jgi:hypothetical protein
VFAQKNQLLVHAAADGNDHASTVLELRDQIGRDFVRGAGGNDDIKQNMLGPSASDTKQGRSGALLLKTQFRSGRHALHPVHGFQPPQN